MHECTKSDFINNLREKLSNFIDKYELKLKDLSELYYELKIRTELQEKDIKSIKSDVTEIKDGMNEISSKITEIEGKDSKRTIFILTLLSANLVGVVAFLIKVFFFGGAGT